MSTTSTGSSSLRSPLSFEGVPRSPRDVRLLAERLGLRPSRRLGQSFLIDPFIADAEAALVGTGAGEPVVEVGGGFGLLTEALLRRGIGPLSVIERDRRLANHLRLTFGDRVTVLEGDARDMPLPPAHAVVGNLPFSAGTPILQRLWRERVPRVVVLLQKEVADRLAAAPGSKTYGRLTIQAALYGRVEAYQVVPSRAFEPSPAVEGRLLLFEGRSGPFPVPSVEEFESIVRSLFGSRRKQLGNLLPRVLPPGASPEEVAQTAAWPVDWDRLRPEALPPDAYFRLAHALAGRGGAGRPAAR